MNSNRKRKKELLDIKDDKVLYFNGLKWLVKETCENNTEAKKKKKELEDDYARNSN
jgi:hypothetical protein